MYKKVIFQVRMDTKLRRERTMNKDKKNTSKLFYWNLTYKEKFQRTLIVLPFLIMAIILIMIESTDNIYKIVVSLLITFVWISQLLYNYKRIETKKK